MGDINKLTTRLSSASMDLVEEEVNRFVCQRHVSLLHNMELSNLKVHCIRSNKRGFDLYTKIALKIGLEIGVNITSCFFRCKLQEQVKYLEGKIHKMEMTDASSDQIQKFKNTEEYKNIIEDMKLLLQHREEISEIKNIIRTHQEQTD